MIQSQHEDIFKSFTIYLLQYANWKILLWIVNIKSQEGWKLLKYDANEMQVKFRMYQSIHFINQSWGYLLIFLEIVVVNWKVLGFNKIEKMAYFSHPRIGIHGTQYHLSDLNQGFIFIWNSASFTQQSRLF